MRCSIVLILGLCSVCSLIALLISCQSSCPAKGCFGLVEGRSSLEHLSDTFASDDMLGKEDLRQTNGGPPGKVKRVSRQVNSLENQRVLCLCLVLCSACCPTEPLLHSAQPAHTEVAQAKAEVKAAKARESTAQAKIRAALERQEKRHKTFLKQLEAQGWRLSAADRIARGSLKQGRDRMAAFLRTAEYQSLSRQRTSRMSGRGIIMAAGGAIPLANAYVTLTMLRYVHKCPLPIELYYNGPHEIDAITKAALELEFSGLQCVDIANYEPPRHQIYASDGHVLSRQQSGWVLKAQMLSATNFAEVLVLDADNVPLVDPAFLFESSEYITSGNLFWPDFWSRNWHNPGPVYDLLNLTEPWEQQPDLLTTESGQFLIDRRKFDEVLEWVLFLNMHADMVYALIWGDKDTYRLAFTLAGQGHLFSQVKQSPANALRLPVTSTSKSSSTSPLYRKMDSQPLDEYAHAGMVQMAPAGQMLFLHRTAGSKMDPYIEYGAAFRPLDFLTPPLTPWQAAQIHITGAIGMSKFDPAKTSKCAAIPDLNLERAAKDCGLLNEGTHGASRTVPIPLFGVHDFPGLSELMQASAEAFSTLQTRFRSRALPLGTPYLASESN